MMGFTRMGGSGYARGAMRGVPRRARTWGSRLGALALLLAAGALGRAVGPASPARGAHARVTLPVSVAERAVTLPDGRPLSGRVRVEAAPHALPALRAEVPWSVGGTLYGWGSVRLFAHPRENELTVSAIVDAPSPAARWSPSCEVHVTLDGRELPLTASYVGAPMRGGVYDAMRMELPIEDVRAMARAREVRGSICGDSFVLDDAQRGTLADFVHHFDLLARPDRAPHETPAQTGPREPEMPGEADEGWQEQG